ncbi:hypothetical protein T484DRAFT_2925482 [Baffinella frigidus]|nr:hypothetical protein T484DRAFT_2925482 [Cryptophyta sp. CCMP2293]
MFLAMQNYRKLKAAGAAGAAGGAGKAGPVKLSLPSAAGGVTQPQTFKLPNPMDTYTDAAPRFTIGSPAKTRQLPAVLHRVPSGPQQGGALPKGAGGGSWSCGQTGCKPRVLKVTEEETSAGLILGLKQVPRLRRLAGKGGWGGGRADGDQKLPDGTPEDVRGSGAGGDYECSQTGCKLVAHHAAPTVPMGIDQMSARPPSPPPRVRDDLGIPIEAAPKGYPGAPLQYLYTFYNTYKLSTILTHSLQYLYGGPYNTCTLSTILGLSTILVGSDDLGIPIEPPPKGYPGAHSTPTPLIGLQGFRI